VVVDATVVVVVDGGSVEVVTVVVVDATEVVEVSCDEVVVDVSEPWPSWPHAAASSASTVIVTSTLAVLTPSG
jgi:hypothetical protein